MSTHNPFLSNFLANSFCPPYSLRWNGRITPSQSRQGNQRVLSPGRWFSSGFIAHVWPGNPRCRLNRVSHCKNTPRPLRGVSIPFNLSLSLRWWLLSLSLVALWMGVLFLSYSLPPLLHTYHLFFCIPIQPNYNPFSYCYLSCPTLFPTNI